MKKKLLIIIGVILFLVAGLLIAPNLIDWNEYKSQVADAVETATGNKVDIRGDLVIKLLPSPALSVSDVSLANVSWGAAENFLELESLDIRLELFPLLNGDYKVTSLLLDGARINLEKNAAGDANWEQLFTGGEEEQGAAGEIALDNFLLRNTEITYSDAATGARQTISDIDADFIISSLTGPLEGEGELTYLGTPVDFSLAAGRFEAGGQVPVEISLMVDGDDPGLTFSGTLVSEESVTALSGTLAGGGDNAANLIGFLGGADGVEDPPAGPWRQAYEISSTILVVLTGDKAEIGLDPLTFSLGETNAEGRIHAISTDILKTEIDLKINALDLDAWTGDDEPGDNEPAQIPEDMSGDFALEIGSATYRGQEIQNASLKASLGDGVFRIENLSATLPGETNARLSGSLQNGRNGITFEGPVHGDTRALRSVLDWLEIDVSDFPENRLVRLDFDGQVKYADPLVEITNTKATLDSTRFTGSITTYLDDSNRFALSGSVNTLDLDSYLPALLDEAETTDLAGRIASLQDSLVTLTGYSGNIDLKAERLKMMGASVENAAFKGTLSGNNVSIENLSAADFEGIAVSLAGSFRDIPGRLDMDVRLSVNSTSLLRLLQWAEIESPFDARVVPTSRIQVTLDGNLSETRFDISGVLSDIAFSFAGMAQDLKTTPRLAADLALSHPRMIEFVRKFSPDYFPARSPLGALEIEARLEGVEDNYTLENLDVHLGPARFQGSLRVESRQGRPFYGGDLAVRVLVMDDFMATPEAGLVQASGNGGARWSADEWDMTFLRENDFDIAFRADSFQFRTYRFLNARVRLLAKDAVLSIENMQAGFFDGTIKANGTMDGTGVPVLDLTMTLENVSTERVLDAAAEIDTLTGRSDFTGTFQATGQSQKAMIATLNGSADLGSRDGVIKGINMPQLSARMGSLNTLSAFKGILGTALERGETPYRYLRTTANITNGVVKIDSIEADVDATEVGGRGVFDLPGWEMDFSGAMRLKEHEDVPAIGVNMTGRIDTPVVKYDHVALSAFMTKRFTTTLFQDLLGPKPPPAGTTETDGTTPTPQQQPPTQPSGAQPVEGAGDEPAEPSPEEQILRGLFDLLGGGEEEEEPPAEEEGGG